MDFYKLAAAWLTLMGLLFLGAGWSSECRSSWRSPHFEPHGSVMWHKADEWSKEKNYTVLFLYHQTQCGSDKASVLFLHTHTHTHTHLPLMERTWMDISLSVLLAESLSHDTCCCVFSSYRHDTGTLTFPEQPTASRLPQSTRSLKRPNRETHPRPEFNINTTMKKKKKTNNNKRLKSHIFLVKQHGRKHRN